MDQYRWAERHDGLLTTEILRASGRTKRGLERDRQSGRIRPVRRGVSAVAGSPRSWEQAVRAVLLSVADDVAASNDTALRLLGGSLTATDSIHVVAPLGPQVSIPGMVAHRSGTLASGDVVTRSGMRCTSPLRTVIDLSSAFDPKELGVVVDDFLRRRMLRLDDLRERVAGLRPAPGRSVRTLRAVLAARVAGYDPGESVLEARISRIIDAAGLPRPTQQHRVSFGSTRYRIDFAWADDRVYLEGNGFGFHSLSSDLDRDARRQNDLVLDGWRPIEVTWRMSDREIESLIRRFLG